MALVIGPMIAAVLFGFVVGSRIHLNFHVLESRSISVLQ